MTLRSLARSVRRSIVGLAALAFAGLFAPGTADAGCWHPLFQRQNEDGRSLEVLDFADFRTHDAPLPAAPEAPKPCTGAFCSGQPGAPSAPVSSVPPPARYERWLGAVGPADSPNPGSARLVVADEATAPILIGTSLFRPPRLGS